MTHGEGITSFSEYLRQLEIGQQEDSAGAVDDVAPQVQDDNVSEAVETPVNSWQGSSATDEAVYESDDDDIEDAYDADEVADDTGYEDEGDYADSVVSDESDNDLDDLFRRLLQVSAETTQSTSSSSRSNNRSSENVPSEDRVVQLEEQVKQMQQMLQQSLQVVQQTAQLMNMQQETEAFRMVARSLQADGIFLSEQQLRDLWGLAYEKGLPPSLVIKAHAFDMLQQGRPNMRELQGRAYDYPFLLEDRVSALDTATPPNEFRSFRDFLRDSDYQRLRSTYER